MRHGRTRVRCHCDSMWCSGEYCCFCFGKWYEMQICCVARGDGHYRRAFIRRPTYLERSELTLATTTIMRLTESHAEAVLHQPVDWNDSARLVSRPESWRDRSKISPVDGRTSAWTKGFPPFPSSTIWSIAKTALQLSCF